MEFHDVGELRVGGRSGIGDGLERLPATAERLVQLHAVEQQLRVRLIGGDSHDQLDALSVEQRQEIDLPAVVERLRVAKRRVGRGRRALHQLCSVPLVVERDERVLDVFQGTRDRVFVAQDGFALSTLGDVVDRLRASGVEDRHRQQRRDIGETRRAKGHAIEIDALATEHGAEDKAREPFGHRLLPAGVGGIELRARSEQVRPPLQQLGRLTRTRRRNGWLRRSTA